MTDTRYYISIALLCLASALLVVFIYLVSTQSTGQGQVPDNDGDSPTDNPGGNDRRSEPEPWGDKIPDEYHNRGFDPGPQELTA